MSLIREDGRIAYEASNHYFYTERNLLEKILRMGQFEKALGSDNELQPHGCVN